MITMPSEWAQALSAVLDDEEAAAWLGANGAVHASRFSWDNTAAATLRAYQSASAMLERRNNESGIG